MKQAELIYNKILLTLQEKDLRYKEGYLKKRSDTILKDYEVSQKYLEKLLESKYEQKKVLAIREAIIKQKYDLMTLVEDIQNPLLLAVTGVGNCGKSSFVNSILKKDIAQVNKRAETWLIDIINYVENDTKFGDGVVYYKGEMGEKKNFEEIKEIIKKEDLLFNKALEKIHQLRLEVNLEDLSRREKQEKAREIEKKYSHKSKLYKLKRFYDIELLKKFRLADTPGLGQSNKSEIKDVLEYYKIADGLVFVVDVDRIDQESTRNSIERVRRKSNVATKILLIINKADDINHFRNIMEKAEKNYGELVDYILPYSAKKVMQGHLENNEALLTDYNYYNAMKFLNKVYTSNKIVRLDKKNESINIILEDSRNDLSNQNKYLIIKNQEYNDNILELKKKSNNIINNTVNNINSNIKATNNIFDRIIEQKVNGGLGDIGFKSQVKNILEDLNVINKNEILKSNEVMKSEMKRSINKSFISDYKWLKNETFISDNFFDEYEQQMLSIEVETYKMGFTTKTFEKIGKGLINIFYQENKINTFGKKMVNKPTEEKNRMIRDEKDKVHSKLKKIREEISNNLRIKSSSFEKLIIDQVSEDFYEKYIVSQNIKKIDVIINSLVKTLALDIISLDVVEILKKENII